MSHMMNGIVRPDSSGESANATNLEKDQLGVIIDMLISFQNNEKRKNDRCCEEISLLKKKIQELEANALGYEILISQKNDIITEKDKENMEYHTQIAKLNREKFAAQSEQQQTLNDLEKVQLDLSEMGAKAAGFESIISQRNDAIKEKDKEITELRKQIGNMTREKEALETSHQEAVQNFEKYKFDLSTKLDKLTYVVNDLTKKHSLQNTQIRKLNSEKTFYEQKMKRFKKDLDEEYIVTIDDDDPNSPAIHNSPQIGTNNN